ncbi:MAG: alpha/beta hydrolase [Acidimicrobiia bacterium]|nr:alpha/beta hydrolase [Acidimicrobiia bacterium]
MTPDGDPFIAHAADGFPVTAWRILSESARQEQRDLQGKTRPHLVFAHATGFCAGVWRPIRSLLQDHDSTALDFRGHGASRSDRTVRSWWEMASDVLAVTGELEDETLIGIGHSMGGAALLMAEMLQPRTFAAFVLVEPIVFPGPHRRNPDHPLVSLARRRRDRFESKQAVRDSYGSKAPFESWHPDALAGYVDGGFVADSGGGVTLACSPQTEAEVFTASPVHGAWARLGEIEAPAVVLYGSDTDTFPPGHAEALAAQMGEASAIGVSGTGHFLPMERPAVVADTVRKMEQRLS